MWQFEIVGLFPPRRWLVMLSACHLARRGRYSSFRSLDFLCRSSGDVPFPNEQNITKWSKEKFTKLPSCWSSHSGHGFCSCTTLPFSIAPLDHVRWPGWPGCPGPDDCCHGSQRSHGKGWEVAVVDSGGLGLGKGCGVVAGKSLSFAKRNGNW